MTAKFVSLFKPVIKIFIFCLLNLEILSITVKVDKGEKKVILIYWNVYNDSLEYNHFE